MMKFKVSAPSGLNGRRAPSPYAEIARIAKRGDTITAEKVVKSEAGGELEYAVTKSGVCYAMTYLDEVKS